MAYRRSIIARSKLFYQQHQRFTPSISHITSSSSSDREELPPPKTISPNSEHLSPFLRYNAGNSLLSGNVSRILRFNSPISRRNFSNVVADKAVEAAPVVNEVALAAADSFAPVAAFQHLIGYVHCYTGLEWWASIAATTLLMRFILLPIHIDYLQHVPVFESHIQKLVKNFQEMRAIMAKQRAPDPKRFDEWFSSQWKLLRAVFPVGRHSLIDVCAISLFFAVYNMVEKVPSFRTGGMLWFTDLTTPDRLYLPILMALTLWIRKMASYSISFVVCYAC